MQELEREEVERKIAGLKARWPAHSVPPRMWDELEELESELERLGGGDADKSHEREAGSGREPQV